MAQMKDFSVSGEDRTDERVACTEAIVINSTTYYRGYLSYIGNRNIAGNTSATYGVWTAASKDGDRLNVLISGPPSGATEPTDVNTISYDPQNGMAYTTTSRTVYFRYRGHGPLVHANSDLVINMADAVAADGSAVTFYTGIEGELRHYARAYAFANINSTAPTTNVTVAITNGTESYNLTIPTTGAASVAEFTDILKVMPSETLTLSAADGYDLHGWTIGLRGPGR